MNEIPKHGGGPRSFDDAWRGLRKRKEQIKRRNQQIKGLKYQLAEAQKKAERYREALLKVMAGRACWSKCYEYGCMCGFKEAKQALEDK